MIDPATIHGAHAIVSALRLMLHARDQVEENELRREHGNHLIREVRTRGKDRVVTLDRDKVTVGLPWWKHAPRDANGRRVPRHVTIPMSGMDQVAYRRPSWWRGGQLHIDAPGYGDRWVRGGYEWRPHKIRFSSGRREIEFLWIAAAIWWIRPDLARQDLDAFAWRPAERPRWSGWPGAFGGREVRMSEQERGRPRPTGPGPGEHKSQRWNAPAGLRQSSRGWGGREVRMHRD